MMRLKPYLFQNAREMARLQPCILCREILFAGLWIVLPVAALAA